MTAYAHFFLPYISVHVSFSFISSPLHLRPSPSQYAGHTQGGGGRMRPLPPCCSHVLPVSRTWSSERKAWQTASATSHWSGLWRGMHMHEHHRYSIYCSRVRADTAVSNMTCGVLWFHPMIMSHYQVRSEIRNKVIMGLEKDPFYQSCRQWRKAASEGLSQYCFINETGNHLLEWVSILNLSFTPDPKLNLRADCRDSSKIAVCCTTTTVVKWFQSYVEEVWSGILLILL